MQVRPRDPNANAGGAERRQHRRRPASEFPDVSARLVGGSEVRLLDLSTRGVLLETTSRLLPGRSVVLRFVTSDTELTLRGCVVRSSVGQLSGSHLRYHTALSFAEDLTILNREDQPADRPYLRLVPTTSVPFGTTEPEAPWSGAMELVATVSQTSTELRELLAANDW